MTGPDDLRARFAQHTAAALVAELAALRPRPGDVPGYATRIALRELGRRAEFLDAQLGHLDELIIPLVTARAPSLLALHGVGPDTAALLLIAAGDHPRAAALGGRLGAPVRRRSDPGLIREDHPPAPQPRRQPGGQPRPMADRDHPDELPPATRAYVDRRTEEGLSKKEIIRCLKRYVAREVYPHLRAGG